MHTSMSAWNSLNLSHGESYWIIGGRGWMSGRICFHYRNINSKWIPNPDTESSSLLLPLVTQTTTWHCPSSHDHYDSTDMWPQTCSWTSQHEFLSLLPFVKTLLTSPYIPKDDERFEHCQIIWVSYKGWAVSPTSCPQAEQCALPLKPMN